MNVKRILSLLVFFTTLGTNIMPINVFAENSLSIIDKTTKVVERATNVTNKQWVKDYTTKIKNGFISNERYDYSNSSIYVGNTNLVVDSYYSLIKVDKNFKVLKELEIRDYDDSYIYMYNFSQKTDNGLLIRVDENKYLEYDTDLNLIKSYSIDIKSVIGDEIIPLGLNNGTLLFSTISDNQLNIYSNELATNKTSKITTIKNVSDFVSQELNKNLSFIYKTTDNSYKMINLTDTGAIQNTVQLPMNNITKVHDYIKVDEDYLIQYVENGDLKLIKTNNNNVLYEKDILEYTADEISKGLIKGNNYYSLDKDESIVNIMNVSTGEFIESIYLPVYGEDYTILNLQRDGTSFYIEMLVNFYDSISPTFATVRLDDSLWNIYVDDGSDEALSLSFSTNQINFNGCNGVEDKIDKSLNITVTSSLPYSMSLTMLEDIKNSEDEKIKINSENLQVKLNEETNYKPLVVGEKISLIDIADSGLNVVHNLNFKLKADSTVKAGNYSTDLLFEIEQK